MQEPVFDAKKFFCDVFDPQADEKVLFLVDTPTDEFLDNQNWKERRTMASEWWQAMSLLAHERHFNLLPIFLYPATGANSAPLPDFVVEKVKGGITLVLAMTTWSATAPLGRLTQEIPTLRVASMPGILKRMEQSALAADYAEIQRRCKILAPLMQAADFCDVDFSTDHHCRFDLRFREIDIDDGYLHQDKQGMRLINLPSGEVCPAPYEGERENEPSKTEGELPIRDEESYEVITFVVRKNRIVEVKGKSEIAELLSEFFDRDPARRNIAECAFGLNPCAIVTGNVLEDEKAGFHWAIGLSSHLGGVWGPEKFLSKETQIHQDFVYAKGSPIQVEKATLVNSDGSTVEVIRNGKYVIF
ncbi:MAG: aminopeptidase [Patescibacteria group bacterium]